MLLNSKIQYLNKIFKSFSDQHNKNIIPIKKHHQKKFSSIKNQRKNLEKGKTGKINFSRDQFFD
jgi:RIO-like serine/threonine protein kinase